MRKFKRSNIDHQSEPLRLSSAELEATWNGNGDSEASI